MRPNGTEMGTNFRARLRVHPKIANCSKCLFGQNLLAENLCGILSLPVMPKKRSSTRLPKDGPKRLKIEPGKAEDGQEVFDLSVNSDVEVEQQEEKQQEEFSNTLKGKDHLMADNTYTKGENCGWAAIGSEMNRVKGGTTRHNTKTVMGEIGNFVKDHFSPDMLQKMLYNWKTTTKKRIDKDSYVAMLKGGCAVGREDWAGDFDMLLASAWLKKIVPSARLVKYNLDRGIYNLYTCVVEKQAAKCRCVPMVPSEVNEKTDLIVCIRSTHWMPLKNMKNQNH